MSLQYVIQPSHGPYSELFNVAIRQGQFTSLQVAVAYATIGGVRVLTQILEEHLQSSWTSMNKSWLVGIDWCRSDPSALTQLANLPNSQLRVPAGAQLVRNPGCNPTQTFHPKLFLLTGPETASLISGSGNLSANGMLRGCECGSLFIYRNERQETERFPGREITRVQQWFDDAWLIATNYGDISESYQKACIKRARGQVLMPTDDDAVIVQPRGLNAIQLQQLRTFDHLWIEPGDLGSNLGKGRPGNQLDMKRFTRVFFGATAEDLQPETPIADLTLNWKGVSHPARTLKYGDNTMDKLNIPSAGDRGEMFYRGTTLLFTRSAPSLFEFTVGKATEKARWRRLSVQRGVIMPAIGRREWGVF